MTTIEERTAWLTGAYDDLLRRAYRELSWHPVSVMVSTMNYLVARFDDIDLAASEDLIRVIAEAIKTPERGASVDDLAEPVAQLVRSFDRKVEALNRQKH